LVIKRPLPLKAGSAAYLQLTAFFSFFGFGFDEKKKHAFYSFSKTFLDFTRRQL